MCYFSLEGSTDTTQPEIYLTVRRKQGEKSSGGYEKSHGQSRLGIMNSFILTRNVQYSLERRLCSLLFYGMSVYTIFTSQTVVLFDD